MVLSDFLTNTDFNCIQAQFSSVELRGVTLEREDGWLATNFDELYIRIFIMLEKICQKHLLSFLGRNWWACSSALPIKPCRTFSNQVCPGAPPAAATPAVQPPCQHTRHLSDHFRASTLPKGAGRRECHISLNNSRNLNKLVVFNEKICF